MLRDINIFQDLWMNMGKNMVTRGCLCLQQWQYDRSVDLQQGQSACQQKNSRYGLMDNVAVCYGHAQVQRVW